ncbi:MAG: DNA polymerase/3'-5' exonuclease PolX, partial [Elusimicrobiota bacterium]
MPVHNTDIARIFKKTADLLEIKGDNPFRIRAYREASRTVKNLSRSISDFIDSGEELTDLPGIGKDLAGKIKDILDTGRLETLDDLEKEFPEGLTDLIKIEGLGPKKVAKLYKELDIKNPGDLKEALESEKIRELEGFGRKTAENISQGLEKLSRYEKRLKISEVEAIAKDLTDYLKKGKEVVKVKPAGSYRRKKETVGDLDIVAVVRENSDITERFLNYEDVDKIISGGDKKSSVVLKNGFQVDLRVISSQNFGAALLYFTGSKAHNIRVRKMAVEKDLKISEYGVFKDDESRIAGETEEEVYSSIGLDYIPPELREDRGEVKESGKSNLPRLVKLEDIKGDLHIHTSKTDGRYSITEMARACRDTGYKYMAISEHTQKVTVAGGLTPDEMSGWLDKIDRVNEKFPDIEILKSAEVDILEDGSLDLPDELLDRMDVVTCSVHYNFNLPREKQTRRILKAMDNPHFNILGHPSGRLINKREPYEINMEEILKKADQKNCFMELNAHPARLDITDIYAKRAKELGIKIVISTDAHGIDELSYMRYGVGQARRGWLEKEDVLNT